MSNFTAVDNSIGAMSGALATLLGVFYGVFDTVQIADIGRTVTLATIGACIGWATTFTLNKLAAWSRKKK